MNQSQENAILESHIAISKDLQVMLKCARRYCSLISRQEQLANVDPSYSDDMAALDEINFDLIDTRETLFSHRYDVIRIKKLILITLAPSRDQITRQIESLVTLITDLVKLEELSEMFLELQHLSNSYRYLKTQVYIGVAPLKSDKSDELGSRLVNVLETSSTVTEQPIADLKFRILTTR